VISSYASLTLGARDLLQLLFNLQFLLSELLAKLLFAAENAFELLDLVSPPIEVKIVALSFVPLISLIHLSDLPLQFQILIVLFIKLASQQCNLFQMLFIGDLVPLSLLILCTLVL